MTMEENTPNLHLQPGDRVRLKMDVYDGNDYGRDLVVLLAPKGSIGIVIPLEEYRAHEEKLDEENNFRRSPHFEDRLLDCKKAIERGSVYPVKFEYVAPTAVECDILSCVTGTIHLIHPFIYMRGKYETALCDYNGETTTSNNLGCRAEEQKDVREDE